RVARGISARVILSAREQTPWMEGLFAKSEENLLEVRIVSPEAYPIEASFAVSGDWVFMESAKKKPFAILIKNEVVARTMESIHDMAWDRYRLT
ncbi:MAG: hypothetical protein HYT27_00265, partial [Parcubacteria group bacterium]|nr:hypothetical protein [Parcubacteria group bacterium]